LISALARNLGLVMRAFFGVGTPRSLQSEGEAAGGLAALVLLAWLAAKSWQSALATLGTLPTLPSRRAAHPHTHRLAM
jgi:hypothetical protein